VDPSRGSKPGPNESPLMYTTCIYCHRPLGSNQIIEAFPVGRGLAFDPCKGRLWVVCRRCRRWNLSPLEERWEAVEECERTFRELRTRVHSNEIGAAVHPEGLRLIRIGEPLPGGEVVKVKPSKVDLLNPEDDFQFGLRVKHAGGETRLYDTDARRAASKIFPVINRFGARRKTVRAAVEQMAEVGGAEAFLRETWGKARPKPGSSIRWVMSRDMKGGGMFAFPPTPSSYPARSRKNWTP